MIVQAKRMCRALLSDGGSFKIRDYEAASLLAWRKQLCEAAAPILDKQLGQLTWLNRQTNERFVLFHSDTQEWPVDFLFPLQSEKTVARVLLQPLAGESRGLKCNIELFRGRFFGMEFDLSPKTVFPDSKTLKLTEFEPTRFAIADAIKITQVEVLADPMETG